MNLEIKTSEVELIGKALFGRSWMAQLASSIINHDGKKLSRQTIKSWHERDNLPKWAKGQIQIIAARRLDEIVKINQVLNDNYSHAVHTAITQFVNAECAKLNQASVVNCRLCFGLDKYDNKLYLAEITLEPVVGAGWHQLTFSKINFQSELLGLGVLLSQKLLLENAVYSEHLNTYGQCDYLPPPTGR